MSRLSAILGPEERARLSIELCTRAISAAKGAGLRVSAISSSQEVIDWTSTVDIGCLPDPGDGLSTAVASAVATLGEAPWIVMHADLPLVSSQAVQTIADASTHSTVLVPSSDGGTNVIASSGPFAFAFGPGSFHRHFAAAPNAAVIPSVELSVDIDIPAHLAVFPEVLRASSLRS